MKDRRWLLTAIVSLGWLLMGTSCARFLRIQDRFPVPSCPAPGALPQAFEAQGFRWSIRSSCADRKLYDVTALSGSGAPVGDFLLELRTSSAGPQGCELRFLAQIPCERKRSLSQCLSEFQPGVDQLEKSEALFLEKVSRAKGVSPIREVTESPEALPRNCE